MSIHIILVMVIVKMKQTMQTVVLMVVTVVEKMSTPIIVQNVFAMNKNNYHVLGHTNLKIQVKKSSPKI